MFEDIGDTVNYITMIARFDKEYSKAEQVVREVKQGAASDVASDTGTVDIALDIERKCGVNPWLILKYMDDILSNETYNDYDKLMYVTDVALITAVMGRNSVRSDAT